MVFKVFCMEEKRQYARKKMLLEPGTIHLILQKFFMSYYAYVICTDDVNRFSFRYAVYETGCVGLEL